MNKLPNSILIYISLKLFCHYTLALELYHALRFLITTPPYKYHTQMSSKQLSTQSSIVASLLASLFVMGKLSQDEYTGDTRRLQSTL